MTLSAPPGCEGLKIQEPLILRTHSYYDMKATPPAMPRPALYPQEVLKSCGLNEVMLNREPTGNSTYSTLKNIGCQNPFNGNPPVYSAVD